MRDGEIHLMIQCHHVWDTYDPGLNTAAFPKTQGRRHRLPCMPCGCPGGGAGGRAVAGAEGRAAAWQEELEELSGSLRGSVHTLI